MNCAFYTCSSVTIKTLRILFFLFEKKNTKKPKQQLLKTFNRFKKYLEVLVSKFRYDNKL